MGRSQQVRFEECGGDTEDDGEERKVREIRRRHEKPPSVWPVYASQKPQCDNRKMVLEASDEKGNDARALRTASRVFSPRKPGEWARKMVHSSPGPDSPDRRRGRGRTRSRCAEASSRMAALFGTTSEGADIVLAYREC